MRLTSRIEPFLARADALLTTERVRIYPAILLAGTVLAALLQVLARPTSASPDYAARWTAGRLLLSGRVADLYDPAVQAALQHAQIGASGLSWFVSPPQTAALFAPLALLPYGWSAIVWVVISTGCLTLALHLLRPWAPEPLARRWHLVVLLTVSSYPVLELVGGGQDTALVLLAFVGGLRLLASGRHVAAGVVLTAGFIKPHLVFLIPVLLWSQGRWRALTAFCLTGFALLGADLVVEGPDIVVTWLRLPGSPAYVDLVQRGQAWKSVNLSAWLMHVAPANWGPAWTTVATGIGLALVIPLLPRLRRTRDLRAASAAVLATTVLASPHVMAYDLVLLVPVLLLGVVPWTRTVRLIVAGLYLVTWSISAVHLLLGSAPWPLSVAGAPWSVIPLLVLWTQTLRSAGSGGGAVAAGVATCRAAPQPAPDAPATLGR